MMTAMEKAIEETTNVNRDRFHGNLYVMVEAQSALEKEYRAIKLLQQTGQLPAELSSYLVANTLICIADTVSDCLLSAPSTLHQINSRTLELEKKYQYDPNASNPSPAPSDLQALYDTYEAERNKIEASVFRSYGEFDLADLLERNPEGYEKLKDADEEYFSPKGGDSR